MYMCLYTRIFLSYGEPCIRRVVPLALAMLSASNPKLEIIDTLSKLSHDSDSEVCAVNWIIERVNELIERFNELRG